MFSRLTYAVAAMVLGVAIAGPAAADNDHQLMSSSGAKALLAPPASSAKGFSALQASKAKSGEDDHAPSSSARSVDDAFSGIALQNDASVSDPHAMLEAQREGLGAPAAGDGFSALKAAAGRHGTMDPHLQDLVLSAPKAESHDIDSIIRVWSKSR